MKVFDEFRLAHQISDVLQNVVFGIKVEMLLGKRVEPFEAIHFIKDRHTFRQCGSGLFDVLQFGSQLFFGLVMLLDHLV